MQRKKTFIVVWLSIVLAGHTSGQIIAGKPSTNVENASQRALERKWVRATAYSVATDPSALLSVSAGYRPLLRNLPPIKPGEGGNGRAGADPGKTPVFNAGSFILLEEDYYTRHFGFFCKKELVMEKTIHLPLRFRLGSLEYCNSLEGKK